jgi:hypothetical protein
MYMGSSTICATLTSRLTSPRTRPTAPRRSTRARHATPGYAISQQKRKRTEEPFRWGKTIGGLARPMLRGVAREISFRAASVGFSVSPACCALRRTRQHSDQTLLQSNLPGGAMPFAHCAHLGVGRTAAPAQNLIAAVGPSVLVSQSFCSAGLSSRRATFVSNIRYRFAPR